MDSVAPMLATGRRSRDGRLEVLSANGDLWLRTRSTAARGAVSIAHRRITQTNGAESDPKFSLDEKQVLFVRDNNAYAFEIATGLTRQLTDRRSGTAPRDAERPAVQRGARAEQQRFLFEVIRDGWRAECIQHAKDAGAQGFLALKTGPSFERPARIS